MYKQLDHGLPFPEPFKLLINGLPGFSVINEKIGNGISTLGLSSLALFMDQAEQTTLRPVKQGRQALYDGQLALITHFGPWKPTQ